MISRSALCAIVLVWAVQANAQSTTASPAAPSATAAAPAGSDPTRRRRALLTDPKPTACAKVEDFLAYRDLSCNQTGSLPLPPATPQQLEANKGLVARFYSGDRSVLADQFIQHDPGEPSTREAWGKFMSNRMPAPGDKTRKQRVNLGGATGYGVVPVDAQQAPVNYMIAEGDIVVAMRFRWWAWPEGPETAFKGVFADIWRVKDGKLAEQWCTCTPEDADSVLIERAKKEGYWVKFKNMNEQ